MKAGNHNTKYHCLQCNKPLPHYRGNKQHPLCRSCTAKVLGSRNRRG